MSEKTEPHLSAPDKTPEKKEETRPGGGPSTTPHQYFRPGIDDDDAGGPVSIRGK